MKFYTSVEQVGDDILYRGYDHGDPVQFREKFSPTLLLLALMSLNTKLLRGSM